MDAMLPFRLRSAPKIFTAVADTLEWVVRAQGVRYVDHYLDDFITLGPANSEECTNALTTICQTCDELGIPLAMEKLEGLAWVLTFLGIEIDMQAGILCLPVEKLTHTHEKWSGKTTCTKRELESLIGTLQHACRIMRPGRLFLRQMIDLAFPKNLFIMFA